MLGIPGVQRANRVAYAGATVLVWWCGRRALGGDTVLDLAWLAREVADTRIAWAFRRPLSAASFGVDADDGLAQRGALGTSARSEKGRRIMAVAGAAKAG